MTTQVALPEFMEDELIMLSTAELIVCAKAFLDEVKRRKKFVRDMAKNSKSNP
jgi:hypothetical protein